MININDEFLGNTILKPTTLYDNSDGSRDTITLNDSVENYSLILVKAISSQGVSFCCVYDKPNDTTCSLGLVDGFQDGNMNRIESERIIFKGNTIQRQNGTFSNLYTSSINAYGKNNNKITKVLGYK